MNENPQAKQKMIVVCEDNANMAWIMSHLLSTKGFKVMTAGDGSEGLELVRVMAPDLLLLDMAMPGTDGLAVLETLKSLPGKRPYTIVVSGQEGKEAVTRATELGAREVWKKPINAAELIAHIEKLVAEGAI